jgi:DNA polymerase bacteriophage-type
VTELRLDFETFNEVDITDLGLDVYASDPSAEVMIAGFAFDRDEPSLWSIDEGPMPRDLKAAMADPQVIKKAWNAQFERVMAQRVLRIPYDPQNPAAGWRCTMFRAYHMSFIGKLDEVGAQMLMPDTALKSQRGKALINMFSMPRKPTKADPRTRWTYRTHPAEWEEFRQYCKQDVVAETAIDDKAADFFFPQREWELYEIDQAINDRGIPVSMPFAEGCYALYQRRKDELIAELIEITGLTNPNSGKQFLPWAHDRGYPFADLKADTIDRVLDPQLEHRANCSNSLIAALAVRRNATKTAPTKNLKVMERAVDSRMRYTLQIGGASRTNRWGGRGLNPQNLKRTPKEFENQIAIEAISRTIKEQNYDLLKMFADEPMDVLAGVGRSVIEAPEGEEFVVADLSSIETAVAGWLFGVRKLLDVFANNKDPYKDFGQVLFETEYDLVTKKQRNDSKPAVLGCGFRLGGGSVDRFGKKTGLWGYAESMGVNLEREDSHKAVKLFRQRYEEFPLGWKALEHAAKSALKNRGVEYCPIIVRKDGSKHTVPVTFVYQKPFLKVILPSGRAIHYMQPRITSKTVHMPPDDEHEGPWSFESTAISFKGKPQVGPRWGTIDTHGGPFTENIVQAIARDILATGIVRAHRAGINIVFHVHDEIVALAKKGQGQALLGLLIELMTQSIVWAPNLPLKAAGYVGTVYKKD